MNSRSSQSAEWTWRFRVLQAEILVWRGSPQDSLTLLNEQLPSALQDSEVAVRRKIVLGMALDKLQRQSDSQENLLAAQFSAETSYPRLLAEAEQALGNLQAHQGKFPEARIHFQRAHSLAQQYLQPFLEANAAGSLGYVATWNQHYDEAIDWYRKSLALSQELHAAASTAKTLGNLGWSYHEVGDLDNALANFRQAERTSASAGLTADRAYWLNSAAATEFDLQQFAAAESDSRAALQLTRPLNDSTAILECLQTLVLIDTQKGQFSEAQQYLDEAAHISDANQPSALYTRLLAAHLAFAARRLPDAERIFSGIARDPGSLPSIQWEAQAGLAEVHSAQGKSAAATREFTDSIARISTARRALQQEDYRLSFLTNSIRFYDSYVNFLIAQQRPIDALKNADLARAQALAQGLSSGGKEKAVRFVASNPELIARRLNATLLFYWLGRGQSWLWVIGPAKTTLFPLPASGDLDALVKSYNDSFTGPRDPLEAGNADGKKLYAALLQPAEKLIPKNSRVIILPDGSLNSLNFETLIVSGPQAEEKPHYWIEDVTVTTANSLSLLANGSVSAPPKAGNLLLIGEPLSASPDFPLLPQADKERSLLENYFFSAQRLELTGKNATATKFLSSQPETFSFLHFATHGTASRTRPLESAIILSPDGDSYKLYARDVLAHPLHAYLVTISACNGAGTKSYAGEGLVGLSWAFLRAGAHNVIAGLWEVSNASTPQLMDELYKGLHAGQDPATALRNAKLTLVHSSGNYRKPFYCAPLLLYSGS